ncbi:claudin-34-like isoform X1, partial [Cricetulus griseus]
SNGAKCEARSTVVAGQHQEKKRLVDPKWRRPASLVHQSVSRFIKSQIDAILEKLVLVLYHHLEALDSELPDDYKNPHSPKGLEFSGLKSMFAVTIMMKNYNHQMGGFALTTMAWLLCYISVGLPQWRVWYYEDPKIFKPTVAFVGIWRACVFYNSNTTNEIRICHQYNYHDSFLPLYIRISQHLLLVSGFLGLFGKITTFIAFWKMCMGRDWRNATCNPLSLSGIVNIIASSFLYLAVLFNYISIIRKWGIAFPPSFNMPSHPDTQKIGSAMGLALLAAVFYLIGGTICLSSNLAIGKTPHYKI